MYQNEQIPIHPQAGFRLVEEPRLLNDYFLVSDEVDARFKLLDGFGSGDVLHQQHTGGGVYVDRSVRVGVVAQILKAGEHLGILDFKGRDVDFTFI